VVGVIDELVDVLLETRDKAGRLVTGGGAGRDKDGDEVPTKEWDFEGVENSPELDKELADGLRSIKEFDVPGMCGFGVLFGAVVADEAMPLLPLLLAIAEKGKVPVGDMTCLRELDRIAEGEDELSVEYSPEEDNPLLEGDFLIIEGAATGCTTLLVVFWTALCGNVPVGEITARREAVRITEAADELEASSEDEVGVTDPKEEVFWITDDVLLLLVWGGVVLLWAEYGRVPVGVITTRREFVDAEIGDGEDVTGEGAGVGLGGRTGTDPLLRNDPVFDELSVVGKTGGGPNSP
jgi:hypothetical protein